MPSTICPHCGKEHHADDPKGIICPQAKKYATCPRCGHLLSSEDNECPNCGEYLGEDVAIVAVSLGDSVGDHVKGCQGDRLPEKGRKKRLKLSISIEGGAFKGNFLD